MLGIYAPKGSLFEVYFTSADVSDLLVKPVCGEFFVRVSNSRKRVLEAKILSLEQAGDTGGAEAVLDVQADPCLLILCRYLLKELTDSSIIKRTIGGGIELRLRISDEAQIKGFRASVDVAKNTAIEKKAGMEPSSKRLLLPPGY